MTTSDTGSEAIFQRLERLKEHHNWTWKQVGAAVGVKVPMLMMVKQGKRKLSEKAMGLLVRSEVEAGLRTKPPKASVPKIMATRAELTKLEKALRKHAKALEEHANSLSKTIDEL